MLTTSVERLEGSSVKLTVIVPAEQVDAAIAETYKEAAAKVRIPGFRPGKAPREMLDSLVGREQLLAEATEKVMNSTYPTALDLENLRPIESPELEEIDVVEPGSDFTYWAQIEVRPELTLSGVEDLRVALPPREATDADVDEYIEMMRERFATLEPVSDRGAAADDFVLISFTGLVDGEPYEGNRVDKYLYEMGRGLMPAEFDAGIVGAMPGNEVHVEFTIPETGSVKEYVGKTASFDITLHEIKAKTLPPIDDEFASNLGGFDTVGDMRTDLKTRLDVQKALAHNRLKETRARAALAERLEGELPEAMILSRQGAMMRDFLSMLDTREITMQDYLEQAGIDMDTLEGNLREQAITSIREELALEALFRDRGMQIAEEDIEAELKEVAATTQTSVDDARARWEELGLMYVLREQIMHRKAVQWLMEAVEVTVEEPEKEKE